MIAQIQGGAVNNSVSVVLYLSEAVIDGKKKLKDNPTIVRKYVKLEKSVIYRL